MVKRSEMEAFLGFIDTDIQNNPGNLTPLSEEMMNEALELCKDIKVDDHTFCDDDSDCCMASPSLDTTATVYIRLSNKVLAGLALISTKRDLTIEQIIQATLEHEVQEDQTARF